MLANKLLQSKPRTSDQSWVREFSARPTKRLAGRTRPFFWLGSGYHSYSGRDCSIFLLWDKQGIYYTYILNTDIPTHPNTPGFRVTQETGAAVWPFQGPAQVATFRWTSGIKAKVNFTGRTEYHLWVPPITALVRGPLQPSPTSCGVGSTRTSTRAACVYPPVKGVRYDDHRSG